MAARSAVLVSENDTDRPEITSQPPSTISPQDISISTRLAPAKASREAMSMIWRASMARITREGRNCFRPPYQTLKGRPVSGIFRQRLVPGVVAVDPVRIGRLAHEGVLLRRALDAGGALAPRPGKARKGRRQVLRLVGDA